ncbi:glycosyltransferase [Ichthyenterobacterium sp. W332]|uniref:Glycosyltransferase n=1 Tax=Microcosmobacter mediterraneus TaxID=3075607 RepID=A0ABU2YGQ6_9FLAO|nr:glycosyltransferase [Ichthyenterobacterium sp. W332]MDT0557364.1 glycosyltransferase [Ichthyenterobacterium sp. W332]
MKTLTIISHTEHYKKSNGNIVGLGSTVTEINKLLAVFEEIIHVAMLHNDEAPSSSLPYISDKITFVPIPALGGHTIGSKWSIIWKMPSVLKTVSSAISKSDYFQFRAPTGIGVFVIPYLVLFSSKKGWFKYAGNWKQNNAPLAYRFQKWMLKKQKRKVTINGFWDDQPKHCLSFENPCLTDEEFIEGAKVIESRTMFAHNIEICFVGRLEAQKGLDLLIDALNDLNEMYCNKISKIHVVGNGNITYYKSIVKHNPLDFIFHGTLSRAEVHDIYKRSHIIVLPSQSEGFPKVITEALNYGCLPIVTKFHAITDYIEHNRNGFLIEELSITCLRALIEVFISVSENNYLSMINYSKSFLQKFTYGYFNNKLKNRIII